MYQDKPTKDFYFMDILVSQSVKLTKQDYGKDCINFQKYKGENKNKDFDKNIPH